MKLSGFLRVSLIILILVISAGFAMPGFCLDIAGRAKLQTEAGQLMGIGDLPGSLKLYEKALKESAAAGDWQNASWAAYWCSRNSMQLDDFDSAVKFGLQALEFANKKGDPNEILRNSQSLGEIYVMMNQPKRARSVADQAMKVARKNPHNPYSQRILALMALISRNENDNAGYIKFRDMALANLKDEVKKWEKDNNPFMVYITGWKIIGLYQELNDYQNAVKTSSWLIDHCRKKGLSMNLPLMYRTRGVIRRLTSEQDKALEDLKTARDLFAKAVPPNPIMQISSYRDLSDVYKDLGQYEQAALELEKALTLQQKHPSANANLPHFYTSLGLIYVDLGRYDLARDNLEKALDIYKNEKKLWGQGMIRYYLARVYFEEGLDNRALEEVNRAVELSSKSGQRYFTFQGYWLKGKILESFGQPKQALKAYQNAEKASYKSYAHFYRAVVLMDRALVQKKLGRHESYKKDVEKALSLSKQMKNIKNARNHFLNLAVTARANDLLGRRGEALKYYEMAIVQLKKLHMPDYKWRYYYRIGEIFEKENKLKQALKAYKNSVKIAEEIRSNLQLEEFRSSFSGVRSRFNDISVNQVYEGMVRVLLKMGRKKEAFNYSERARSRALLDMLNQETLSVRTGEARELARREREINSQIAQATAGINHATKTLRGRGGASMALEMEDDLDRLKVEYQKVLLKIKLVNRDFYDLKTVDPLPIEEVSSTLDDKTAIVEYLITNQDVKIFIVRKDSIEVVESGTSAAVIYRYVMMLRRLLKNPDQSASARLDKVARSLGKVLIDPVTPKLQRIENLIIIPNRTLHFIPFAVLKTSDGSLLLKQFVISYAPSASVAAMMMKKKPGRRKTMTAFALGDNSPVIGGIRWEGLPGTREEVKTISELFADRILLTGTQLTRNGVQKSVKKADFVHFATHGVFNASAPLFSGLVLSDGMLTVKDIFKLKLDAYLVVLSACQTGLGKLSGGDEIVGLSRAFMYAGAPSMIVSLWSVSDSSTTRLMQEFYRQLKSGKSRAQALQRAQLEMQQKNPHPFYWAPFVIIGDPR